MTQRTCPDCGIIISARARKCRKCSLKRNYTDDPVREWRQAVFVRDNYTCRRNGCGRDRKLEVHHVLNYRLKAHVRVDVDNGMTLCKGCHDEFHRRFGKYGNSWWQMKHFLKEAADDSQAVL